jgi:hypothetical protein
LVIGLVGCWFSEKNRKEIDTLKTELVMGVSNQNSTRLIAFVPLRSTKTYNAFCVNVWPLSPTKGDRDEDKDALT